MRITDFDIYKDLLKEKSGIVLTPDKSYLLDSRLGPIAKKWGYPSLEAMTLALQGVPDHQLINDVVEAMTSNETSFFRDAAPFHFLQDTILPYMAKSRKKKKVRIHCTGCSTGQEPYSVAISIKEKSNELPLLKTEIIASDISHDVIQQAQLGAYSQLEVQRGLRIDLLLKYFEQRGRVWKLNPQLRQMVRFEHLNLLERVDHLGQFDIIFCRNILDDLMPNLQQDILAKILATLADDGFLILGAGEKPQGLPEEILPLKDLPYIYVRQSSPHAQNLETLETPLASGAVSS